LTDDELFSPRLNVAWRLDARSVVRGSWGHFYQSQRPNELDVMDGETEVAGAERAEHWVLGYERSLGGERSPLTALRVEAYHRKVRDPRVRYERLFEVFSTFPEIEPDRVRIAPRSHRARGIELLLRGTAGERTDWWLSYGYSSAEDRLSDGPGARWVPRLVDQPHSLALSVRRSLPNGWNLALAWRYHSGWPTTPIEIVAIEAGEVAGEDGALRIADEEDGESGIDEAYQLGAFNSARLAPYHRLDLRLSRGWQVPSGRLLFFVDVQNLYNRKNVAGFDLAVEEGALTINEETWPGLFPSLGISWSF
jgi:outer membrane receptor protein involved in Fe transport